MIFLICKRHYNFENHKIALGGVDSYVYDLAHVLISANYKVEIFQESDKKTSIIYDGVEIIGTGANNVHGVIKCLEGYKDVDFKNDILIFSTDYLIVPTRFRKVIAIQHGVAWDITSSESVPDYKNTLTIWKGSLRSMKKYNRFKHCNHLVCVDYNFLNWYRTQVMHIDTNIHIIPNYSKIPMEKKGDSANKIKIIFARRLVKHRGTRIFTGAIQKVLKVHPEIEITIAGDGPEKKWMQNQLQKYNNVVFTEYGVGESLGIHQRHDIAVVPTCGSEGTSLSLLEAMAAGCAVIATNVGGMTNIILDGYNGLMISPEVDQLAQALLRLIEDDAFRRHIAQKGRETVMEAFSFEKWRGKWIQLVEEISENTEAL